MRSGLSSGGLQVLERAAGIVALPEKFLYLGCGGHFEYLARKSFRRGEMDIRDLGPHDREADAGHAERIEAQTKQQLRQNWVARHFSTDTTGDVGVFRGVKRQFEQTEDAQVRGLVEMRRSAVRAVHRQAILDEVIAADN